MDYFLTSERLGFRCWRDDDLPLAMELWGDPAVTAMIGGRFTSEQVQTRLANEIALMRDAGVQYWPVFLLDGHGFAGCAGLRPKALSVSHPFRKERGKDGVRGHRTLSHTRCSNTVTGYEVQVYELGFHLLRSCWGRGLAVESARAVIGYGFGTLGADALFAGHHPANAASRRVLLKLGFEYAGEEFYAPSEVMEPVYLLRK